MTVHIQIIFMVLKMQKIFRRTGHITGYKGELVLVLLYLFYSGSILLQLIYAVLIFKVNTTSYECPYWV